jgi:predicted ATPase
LALVDIYARAGRDEVALEMISDTMELIEETDERWAEPELHRVRGELLKSTDKQEAERSFTTAIEIARHQFSRSFELRAAMSLCRFHSGGKRKTTLDEVRRLFESFSEGFETGDLLDARAMLAT